MTQTIPKAAPSTRDYVIQRYGPLLILAILAAVLFALLSYTRSEPLERDATDYAVVAQEMLGGRGLYSQVFDQKPPAIHLTYAVGEIFFGYNRAMIFDLAVLAAWCTLIGIYVAGSALGGRRIGLLAALFWTIVCTDVMLEANIPNAEVFMNGALIWAFALLLRIKQNRYPVITAIVIGLLFAWASLYKPVVGVDAILIMAAFLAMRLRDKRQFADAFKITAVVAATIALSWLALIACFALTHDLKAMYEDLFVYNMSYSGNKSSNLVHGLFSADVFPGTLYFLIPSLIVMVIGAVHGIRRGRGLFWLPLIGYLVASNIAIALPGQFFPHYYQLYFPVICLGAAWGIYEITQFKSLQEPNAAAFISAALITCLMLFYIIPCYQLSPDVWSEITNGSCFLQAEHVAEVLKPLLRPDETFYDAGAEPEFFIYLNRLPTVQNGQPITGPFIQEYTRQIMQGLEKAPPDMAVVCSVDPMSPVIQQWLRAHYQVMPTHIKGNTAFTVLVLRGSPLAARVGQAAVQSSAPHAPNDQ